MAAQGGRWPLLHAKRETEAETARGLALRCRSTSQIWVPGATLASLWFAQFLMKCHEDGCAQGVFADAG